MGPVGRGATVEFVECRRLGEWTGGVIDSANAPPALDPAKGPLPAAYDVGGVGQIVSSTAPFWFFGCSFLMASTASGLILAIGLFYWLIPDFKPIGPVEPGVEFYDSVVVDESLDMSLLEGLEQPYYRFVMEPNMRAAGGRSRGWEEPAQWDQRFLQFVTASVERHAQSWSFFRRIDAVKNEYSKVVLALRREGLPEVFAAIPYQESRYNASITSEVCAEGYWQFMPEVAHRLNKREGLPFRVANCKFRGSKSVNWTPTEYAPPPSVRRNATYIDGDKCIIDRCDIDDRKNLERSTNAAMFTLKEAWNDPLFASSGSAVQLTITSHNAGYDDSRFGAKFRKRFNVRPAYKAYVDKNGTEQGRLFTGANIRCRTWNERSTCNAAYMAETQHYAYTIVAQHFLAVCYYAKNYGSDPAFSQWAFYVGSEGYCNKFKIPSREDVARKRRGGASRDLASVDHRRAADPGGDRQRAAARQRADPEQHRGDRRQERRRAAAQPAVQGRHAARELPGHGAVDRARRPDGEPLQAVREADRKVRAPARGAGERAVVGVLPLHPAPALRRPRLPGV